LQTIRARSVGRRGGKHPFAAPIWIRQTPATAFPSDHSAKENRTSQTGRRKSQTTLWLRIGEFHRLAQFFLEMQFDALNDEYSAGVTDAASTFTTAVIGGKRKTIRNYANDGPSRLWAIERLLDGILSTVKWDEL
jgi:hypothetical protein